MYFLARHTLFSNPLARWLFPKLNVVPVDQDRAGFTGLKTIIKMLGEGKRVILFPEGSRSFDGKLQPAQAGSGLVVSKARVPVRSHAPLRRLGVAPAGRMENEVPLRHRRRRKTDPLRPGNLTPSGKDGYQKISDRIMDGRVTPVQCVPTAFRRAGSRAYGKANA
ncbi:MAG: lysophospholipid acyltransferase family protein [Nibricoccus sp.]